MDAEDVPLELSDLTEALTCAICKELFDGPVLAPCGHTFCSMCIRQSLDFAHTNKQKGTCPSCRADCNADQLRRVDAVRLAISALPRAAAAVHDLRRRLEDSERRQQGAEHELSVARGRSGPGNAVASGAAATAVGGAGGAAHQPGGGCSHELAEAPTGAVAGSVSGRPRRGAAQQQASQPPARSTRQLARQAQGGRSSKRRAVGDAGTRRAAGGEASEDEEDDKSDFEEVSDSVPSGEGSGPEVESEAEGAVPSDGDEDYSPDGRCKGRRPSTAAVGPAPGARKRGRPPKTVTTNPSAAKQAGGARASGSAPSQVPVPAPASAPAPQNGIGDCPLCGRTYGMSQLQAHVDMCLTRQTARPGGAAGPAAAAASLARGPSPAPAVAATAGGAKPAMNGLLARSFGSGAGAGAGAGVGADTGAGQGSLRGRPSVGGAAASGGACAGAGAGVPAVPSRPPTEVKVPPAHAWHSMTDKAARKIMAGIGLPTIGDKNDWSGRYNRYRTFLRTERDRCTTLTMDQLLRAFLQKEQQEDAGRRQPAAAPTWMLNQIREAAERMKAVQRLQQAAAAQRVRSAPAEGADDDGAAGGGGGDGGEDVSPAEAQATAAAASAPPVTANAAPPTAAAAAAVGSGPAERDVIMIGSDSEEDSDQRQQVAIGATAEQATATAAAVDAGKGSRLGLSGLGPGNGGPEPGAPEPRLLAPAGEDDVPGRDAAASSMGAAAEGAAASQCGAEVDGGDWPTEPHVKRLQHSHRVGEQAAELDREQDETPPPRCSQWMRAGSPPPGADEHPSAGHPPVGGASCGLPWALDYGGRGAGATVLGAGDPVGFGQEVPGTTGGGSSCAGGAGGGWLADISNGVGSQRQAWPSLQAAGEGVTRAAGKASTTAWSGQRTDTAGFVVSEQHQEQQQV